MSTRLDATGASIANAEATRRRWGRVAICHEWLTELGGAEQVAGRIASNLGVADVYTFAADAELCREIFPGCRVVELGALFRAHRRLLLPLIPWVWRRLNLDDYDVVITSSYACTNAIRVKPRTLHISYCHTPMRYAWEWRSEMRRVPAFARPAWPLAAQIFKAFDRRWAKSVDMFIANSNHVAQRIRKYYGRDSIVIHPPVDTEFWSPPRSHQPREFFLCAGRLVPYKRFDLAVRAANRVGVPLLVAGSGPDLAHLRHIAQPNVQFVERPSKLELRDLYRRAIALVFPGVEDFGIAVVEAQACRTPVVAYGRGGVLDTVVDGVTGRLLPTQEVESLSHALKMFDPAAFDSVHMREQAVRFDQSVFDHRLRTVITECLERAPRRCSGVDN